MECRFIEIVLVAELAGPTVGFNQLHLLYMFVPPLLRVLDMPFKMEPSWLNTTFTESTHPASSCGGVSGSNDSCSLAAPGLFFFSTLVVCNPS